jgi:hypothetical protein
MVTAVLGRREATMAEANRTSYASIAGVLCIVSGGTGLFGGLILSTIGLVGSFLPPALGEDVPIVVPFFLMMLFGVLALMLFGLGGLAIAGGLAGLRRTRWGLLLAGASASVICFVILGVPALVFAILAEKEFLPSAAQPRTQSQL